jgi:ATP-dependent metalloprotease
MVMPSGAIKIPNLGGLGGAMPEVPPIPGSVEDKPPASKEPPAGAGGAIA